MANISGVPDTISRELVLRFLRSVGLEPSNVTHLGLNPKGIYAKTFVRSDEGTKLIDHDGPLMNTVFIRFVD